VLQDRDHADRLKAAVELLKLAQLPPASSGAAAPTDPQQIVEQIVRAKRERFRGPLDDTLDGARGLPPLAKHVEQTWRELEALASEADALGGAKGEAGDNAP
jgi:hypothetical protein